MTGEKKPQGNDWGERLGQRALHTMSWYGFRLLTNLENYYIVVAKYKL